jgi:hypothetical protein
LDFLKWRGELSLRSTAINASDFICGRRNTSCTRKEHEYVLTVSRLQSRELQLSIVDKYDGAQTREVHKQIEEWGEKPMADIGDHCVSENPA